MFFREVALKIASFEICDNPIHNISVESIQFVIHRSFLSDLHCSDLFKRHEAYGFCGVFGVQYWLIARKMSQTPSDSLDLQTLLEYSVPVLVKISPASSTITKHHILLNIMAADALAHYVARTSAAMILTM